MGSAARKYSDATERQRAYYEGLTEVEQLSPRLRMGLRLYAHTAVPTLKEAAISVGVHPVYLQQVARTVAGRKFMETAHTLINDTALKTTDLIEKLSRRAIEVIGTTMEDASSEGLRLKAAIDLADRGPETSKIQKHQVEAFTLSSSDARGIAEAMVSAAQVRMRHADLATNDFDRVNIDGDEDATPVVVTSPQLKLEP